MRQIADFHIHSKYSRACSRDLDFPNIERACRTKGIDIIGTGDFTFPEWIRSFEEETEEIGNTGLYKLRNVDDMKVKFILTSEVALIYKQGGKARRVHIVMHAPNLASVKELNSALDKKYNIRSDGRPILGMSIKDLMGMCFSIHPDFLIYPAHIWTPWFSIFGSKSGFDSLEEAFGDYTEKIYAYETGLSSDPEMNWRLSALDRLSLLSNSDSHSLQNLAREATVFDIDEVTYDSIFNAIKDKDAGRIKYTIEFYPEEGMYHYDGHRDCGIRFSPEETKKNKGICPVCRKPLVIGVMYRVDELADRPAGFLAESFPGFRKLVGLDKVIADIFGVKSRSSKKVKSEYDKMIKAFGSELSILLDASEQQLTDYGDGSIGKAIIRMRKGQLAIEPGFDGVYGVVKIDSASTDVQAHLL